MLYVMVVIGYTVANIVLALTIYSKSRRNILSQFYSFCVGCLVFLSIVALLVKRPVHPYLWLFLYHTAVFVYALMPFFFLHFIVMFVRKYEILKAKHVTVSIYFVGLFSYALVLLGFIPTPVTETGTISPSGYIFYLTWMTIFFAIGVALLYEVARGFYEKAGKANVLFISFLLLLLILPGPFTDSVFINILHLGPEWYFISCTIAIIIAVYYIFRHKIIVNTLYDALKTALSVVNDIVITMDASFRIEMIQGAVTPLLGFREEEMIGRSFLDFIDQKEYLEKYRDLVLQQKKAHTYLDVDAITKGGEHVPMNISVTPMVFGKEIIGYVSIARDVTEHRKLEEQLRQAQKMESLGTLAGGIAHDFNNILQIIQMNTTSLQKHIHEPERVAKIMGFNQTAVERGAGLVRQILIFARKTEIVFEPVNLNLFISESLTMMESTFPRTVLFSTQLSESLPLVNADRNQLYQVLLNLCLNARDAMPNGGRIMIGTEMINRESLLQSFPDVYHDFYLRLSVTDSGDGMDEKTRQRVFEPFFTTKGKEKGTGLGLAVVYGIVKSHHGLIDVESSVGKGTTFRVFLPDILKDRPMLASTPKLHDRGGHEKILVVEDEEVLLSYLQTVLEEKGYSILVAKDGEEAVEVYMKHRNDISLVVCDIGLPKLDGWNALLQMQKINPRLRAIAATGYLDPEERAKKFGNGFLQVILKPYQSDEILTAIRNALDVSVSQTP